MNDHNLIPFTERSENETRAMGAKGGVKSGEVRRERARLAKIAEALGDSLCYATKNGAPLLDPTTGQPMTYNEAIAFRLVNLAVKGDLKAIKLFAELTGQLKTATFTSFPSIVMMLGEPQDAVIVEDEKQG